MEVALCAYKHCFTMAGTMYDSCGDRTCKWHQASFTQASCSPPHSSFLIFSTALAIQQELTSNPPPLYPPPIPPLLPSPPLPYPGDSALLGGPPTLPLSILSTALAIRPALIKIPPPIPLPNMFHRPLRRCPSSHIPTPIFNRTTVPRLPSPPVSRSCCTAGRLSRTRDPRSAPFKSVSNSCLTRSKLAAALLLRARRHSSTSYAVRLVGPLCIETVKTVHPLLPV